MSFALSLTQVQAQKQAEVWYNSKGEAMLVTWEALNREGPSTVVLSESPELARSQQFVSTRKQTRGRIYPSHFSPSQGRVLTKKSTQYYRPVYRSYRSKSIHRSSAYRGQYGRFRSYGRKTHGHRTGSLSGFSFHRAR